MNTETTTGAETMNTETTTGAETMNTPADIPQVTFRKITTGLYGTGIMRTDDHGREVEVVIDKADGFWWRREAIIDDDGFDLTGWLGECYRTLADAKRDVMDFPY